jgi:predicted TIM-barrel fold metal-dependent hydrolase
VTGAPRRGILSGIIGSGRNATSARAERLMRRTAGRTRQASMSSHAMSSEKVVAAANRLGLNYRAVPRRTWSGPITDIHTHVNDVQSARTFFEAANAYGIARVVSMTPIANAPALREAFGPRIALIAIPNWREEGGTPAFRARWIENLAAFRALGARLCKFWMAPPMRQRHGITLEHEFVRPVIQAAIDFDYEFMVHVGDPSVWWRPGGRYSDTAVFGTKLAQYEQLRWFLDHVAPRRVIAAHMGGFIEDPAFLDSLLDAHANLHLDTSATKWIVREVSRQPTLVQALVTRRADRILFGSDLVTSAGTDHFDHYASRYWAHLQMWETGYRGQSPIDDPDADQPPQLAGVDLPQDVLAQLYAANADRFALFP